MDYITYSRKFQGYKWFKPFLEILLSVLFWGLATILCLIISMLIAVSSGTDVTAFIDAAKKSYDSFDAYSLQGAIFSLGSIACLVPAVAFATKIVKGRPFHSVASSCGGFDFGIFGKAMITALILIGIPVAVSTVVKFGNTGVTKFTVLGFIACIILGPLQCAGEEFLFRGVMLQGIGSWVKRPLLAIALQSILFAAGHPYNIWGFLEVLCSGLILGYLVYRTRGLEASCAAHIVNNMVLFILNGFGFESISSNGTVPADVLLDVAINGLFLVCIIFAGKKYNWFNRTPKETDVTDAIM